MGLALAGAVVALWSRDDVLDAEGFVDTTAPVVERSAVRDAVAELTVEALGAQPPPVQEQIRAGARELAASERFAALWRQANGAAHALAQALIRGDGNRVVLDVGGLADLVVERLRAAGVDVGPEDIDRAQTRVTVLDASEASAARDVASWAERLAVVLPAVFGGGLVALLLLPRRSVGLTAAAVAAVLALLGASVTAGDAESRLSEKAPDGPRGVVERAYGEAMLDPLHGDLRRGMWIAVAAGCACGAAALWRQQR